jgi:hypothetical protein
LAFRYNGQCGKYLDGCWRAINKEGVRTSIREGGTLIGYEDEDPQIRKDFETAVERAAVPMEIPVFSTTSCETTFRAMTEWRVTYEKFVAFDLVTASDVAARV